VSQCCSLHALTSLPLSCLTAAPGKVVPPPYKVSKTGNEFVLRTNNMSWSNAQKECNIWGGHLASYVNRDEQIEVEQFYISNGYLFPKYNTFYWMGLTTPTADPQVWGYVDPTAPFNSTSYQNWGVAVGDDNMGPEPNNFFGDEKCAGGNFTEAKEGAAGWADAQCGQQFVFMCRLLREWRPRVRSGACMC
jgi:hypothetical protein